MSGFGTVTGGQSTLAVTATTALSLAANATVGNNVVPTASGNDFGSTALPLDIFARTVMAAGVSHVGTEPTSGDLALLCDGAAGRRVLLGTEGDNVRFSVYSDDTDLFIGTTAYTGSDFDAAMVFGSRLALVPTTLPSAHATRSQIFCISDDLSVVPGSGGDGGLRVYDPDGTTRYARLYWNSDPTAMLQSTGNMYIVAASGSEIRLRAADGTTWASVRENSSLDDTTAGSASDIFIACPIHQGRLLSLVPSTLPSAHATRVQAFAISDDFAIVPGSGASGGLRVYDPDATSNYYSLFHVAGVTVLSHASGEAWLRLGGNVRKSSDQGNATTTLADDSALTVSVLAGRAYRFRAVLLANCDTAAEGIKANVRGTATVASLLADVRITSHAATPVIVMGRLASLAATAIGQTTAGAGAVTVEITGTMATSGAGTFVVAWAQNAHVFGTTTVAANSFIELEDVT